jgi:hypothetical protein
VLSSLQGTAEPGPRPAPCACKVRLACILEEGNSNFVPNKLMPWNTSLAHQVGNPAKSIEVNELIKAVIKIKKCKNKARPLLLDEHLHITNFFACLSCQKQQIKTISIGVACQACLLSSTISLPGLTMLASFCLTNLSATDNFDFVLQSKLNWSKNVHGKRKASNQILLGAMNFPWCAR